MKHADSFGATYTGFLGVAALEVLQRWKKEVLSYCWQELAGKNDAGEADTERETGLILYNGVNSMLQVRICQ